MWPSFLLHNSRPYGTFDGNIQFVHFLSLYLIRCMLTILGFSKSIIEETYGYKNHIRIKIWRNILILGFGCSQIKPLRWRTCLKVSYSQDLLLNDLNHNLSTPKLERKKLWLSLFGGRRQLLPRNDRKPNP